jgi:UDP-glucose 4-epimerase
MRILITGGAGFIGSHLAFDLQTDHDVTVFDNFSSGTNKNLRHFNGKIVVGDIRDSDAVNKLIESHDLVIHMAAALGVETILRNPIESISTNIAGSEIVLLAAAKANKRIIIASTSEIYGKNPNQPLAESHDRLIGPPQNIRWSYSDAKAIEEAIAQALYNSNGLKVTTLRFFNTVGPRQTGRYGMVVPRFVKSALNETTLKVYGDGSQQRVFCHVLDAVNAVRKVMASDSTIGEVFNVGGIDQVTIMELAELIISRTKSKSKIELLAYADAYPAGFEDMQKRVPDLRKIEKFTGWKPIFRLDSIIEDVAKYFRANSELD